MADTKGIGSDKDLQFIYKMAQDEGRAAAREAALDLAERKFGASQATSKARQELQNEKFRYQQALDGIKERRKDDQFIQSVIQNEYNRERDSWKDKYSRVKETRDFVKERVDLKLKTLGLENQTDNARSRATAFTALADAVNRWQARMNRPGLTMQDVSTDQALNVSFWSDPTVKLAQSGDWKAETPLFVDEYMAAKALKHKQGLTPEQVLAKYSTMASPERQGKINSATAEFDSVFPEPDPEEQRRLDAQLKIPWQQRASEATAHYQQGGGGGTTVSPEVGGMVSSGGTGTVGTTTQTPDYQAAGAQGLVLGTIGADNQPIPLGHPESYGGYMKTEDGRVYAVPTYGADRGDVLRMDIFNASPKRKLMVESPFDVLSGLAQRMQQQKTDPNVVVGGGTDDTPKPTEDAPTDLGKASPKMPRQAGPSTESFVSEQVTAPYKERSFAGGPVSSFESLSDISGRLEETKAAREVAKQLWGVENGQQFTNRLRKFSPERDPQVVSDTLNTFSQYMGQKYGNDWRAVRQALVDEGKRMGRLYEMGGGTPKGDAFPFNPFLD